MIDIDIPLPAQMADWGALISYQPPDATPKHERKMTKLFVLQLCNNVARCGNARLTLDTQRDTHAAADAQSR
ncbi:MAG TPA: hypothetical protein VK980_13000, partial [Sphingomonas sp.]|nr:hypothetical protein [Sphingomonas sp.]